MLQEKHASFLDSTTSECYELDLPPVPEGLLRDGNSTRYQPPPQCLHLKAQSPVYTNVNRTLALGVENALSPTELSTIVETEDQPSSDDGASISSDDREDVSQLHIKAGDKADNGVPENQPYTELHQSTMNDPSIYDIPAKEGSTERFFDSERSSERSSTDYIRASPENLEHQTRYTRAEDNSSKRSMTWVRRTLRHTFRYRYRMEMVDMKMCCCSGSHSGAKKFFIFSGVILLILLVSLLGLVVGISSYVVMRQRANMIEGELNTYTTSLRYCRVGRNWTSISINSSSKSLCYNISEETLDVPLDVPLDNLTQATMGRNTASLGATQLLLYVVIHSNTRTNESYDPSYVNVALWTRSRGSEPRQFRQYMAILNDLETPQIVSRSFWFPLEDTNNHFYVSAEVMEGDLEMAPLKFIVYLAGHC